MNWTELSWDTYLWNCFNTMFIHPPLFMVIAWHVSEWNILRLLDCLNSISLWTQIYFSQIFRNENNKLYQINLDTIIPWVEFEFPELQSIYIRYVSTYSKMIKHEILRSPIAYRWQTPYYSKRAVSCNSCRSGSANLISPFQMCH